MVFNIGKKSTDVDTSAVAPIYQEPSTPQPVKRQSVRTPLPEQPQRRELVTIERRYIPFVQQPREGIIDATTNEPIFDNIWSVLADIVERLERIETRLNE